MALAYTETSPGTDHFMPSRQTSAVIYSIQSVAFRIKPLRYIPLHRVATVIPFMGFLRQMGVPLERELHRAKLPVLAIDDADYFVPSRNYWAFIANVADREGIEDLGFLVGQRCGADAADPGLTSLLLRSPTLYHALDRFRGLATAEISQVTLRLAPMDNNKHRLHYRPSFACDHPAYVHFQWYGLMAAIGAIRLFAGRQWQPEHIGLGSQRAPGSTI